MAAPSRRHRRALVRSASAVAGLALGLVAAETALRLVNPRNLAAVVDAYDYLRIGLVPAPGGRYWQNRAGLDWTGSPPRRIRVTIGPDARRVTPAPPGAAAGPTVVLLGDSMAFGLGVDDRDTYAAALASRLGARVLNTAVPGYNTHQERLALEALEPELAPDLVLLHLVANDDGDIGLVPGLDPERALDRYFNRRPRGWRRRAAGAAFSAAPFLATALRLGRSRPPAPQAPPARPSDGTAAPGIAEVSSGLAFNLDAWQAIAGWCASRDVPLVAFSTQGTLDPWAAFARRHGLAYLALDVNRDEDVLGPWDRHLSAAGHRRVADRLAPVVRAASRR